MLGKAPQTSGWKLTLSQMTSKQIGLECASVRWDKHVERLGQLLYEPAFKQTFFEDGAGILCRRFRVTDIRLSLWQQTFVPDHRPTGERRHVTEEYVSASIHATTIPNQPLRISPASGVYFPDISRLLA